MKTTNQWIREKKTEWKTYHPYQSFFKALIRNVCFRRYCCCCCPFTSYDNGVPSPIWLWRWWWWHTAHTHTHTHTSSRERGKQCQRFLCEFSFSTIVIKWCLKHFSAISQSNQWQTEIIFYFSIFLCVCVSFGFLFPLSFVLFFSFHIVFGILNSLLKLKQGNAWKKNEINISANWKLLWY